MSANIRETIDYFAKIFEITRKLTDEQLDSILKGTGTLQYKDTRVQKKTPATNELIKHSEHIMSLTTREEATDYITSLKFSKEKLTQLADLIKVNINKSDKKDIIINKIVESVVGFKLRNEAIMSMDLKR